MELYFIYYSVNGVNKAYFSTDLKYEKIYTIGQIKWRNTSYNVNLIYIGNPPNLTEKKPKKYDKKIFSLMKSNLQKQVRRQDVNALATSQLLLDLDEFEFLRRLSVIAAEDSEISCETSVITWLMAASSKGYILTNSDKKFIFKYVYSIIIHPNCQRLKIKFLPNDPNWTKYNANLNPSDILKSNHDDKYELLGIFFRVAYGGLKGDGLMISRLCDEIIQSTRRLIKFNLVNDDDLKKILNAVTLDISEAAVDHHIYPNLPLLIFRDLSDLNSSDLNSSDLNLKKIDNDQFVKKIIWERSSGINNRQERYCEEEWETIWKYIYPLYRKHSLLYLNSVLNSV